MFAFDVRCVRHVLAALPATASILIAQGDRCSSELPPSAQIGVERFECVTDAGCEINVRTSSGPLHRFATEPTVWGIVPDGPAAGRLRDGDAIVAVDGALITTPEAGQRLARLTAKVPVVLRIRRGTEELDVRLTPNVSCRHPQLVVRTPREPSLRAAGRDPIVEADRLARSAVRPAAPRVEFGMQLSCVGCAWRQEEGALLFDAIELPTVSALEADGPAAVAGFRVGDVLLAVNGASLTSREGGLALGRLSPGDRATFRVRRGSATQDLTLVARAPRAQRSF
jgi:S1-C subfamily serine protease